MIEDLVARYSKAVSGSLRTKERTEVLKLAEVLKAYSWGQANRLVMESGNKPLLYSYSADGTPITTKEKVVKRLAGKTKVRRVGSSTSEFLVQQGFVRCLDHSEAPQDRRPAPGPHAAEGQ